MNVLLLIPTAAVPGGTQKLLSDIGRLLAEEHTVIECSFDPPGTERTFGNPNEFIAIGDGPAKGPLSKALSYARLAARVRAIKRRRRIDVAVSFIWNADLVNVLARGRARRVSIGVVNILGNFQNRRLLEYRSLAGVVYRRFDKVVAINRDLATELRGLFGLRSDRVGCIHPFVERPSAPADENSVPSFPRGRMRIGWLGRINPIKNLIPLLDLMPRIRARVPGVQLLVIGEGPQHLEAAAAARRAGLRVSDGPVDSQADVVFMGFVDDPYAYLVQCHLFALTSQSEGFGLVIAEAMGLGLPVVASDCPTGGPHLILEGRHAFRPGRQETEETSHGYLLPVPHAGAESAAQAWEDAITRLLTDADLRERMSRSAQGRSVDFSRAALRDQWLGLIGSPGA